MFNWIKIGAAVSAALVVAYVANDVRATYQENRTLKSSLETAMSANDELNKSIATLKSEKEKDIALLVRDKESLRARLETVGDIKRDIRDVARASAACSSPVIRRTLDRLREQSSSAVGAR